MTRDDNAAPLTPAQAARQELLTMLLVERFGVVTRRERPDTPAQARNRRRVLASLGTDRQDGGQ